MLPLLSSCWMVADMMVASVHAPKNTAMPIITYIKLRLAASSSAGRPRAKINLKPDQTRKSTAMGTPSAKMTLSTALIRSQKLSTANGLQSVNVPLFTELQLPPPPVNPPVEPPVNPPVEPPVKPPSEPPVGCANDVAGATNKHKPSKKAAAIIFGAKFFIG